MICLNSGVVVGADVLIPSSEATVEEAELPTGRFADFDNSESFTSGLMLTQV